MAEQTAVSDADPRDSLDVTPRVLVFFDYACQFCYLDWPRFKRLRAEHAAELFLVPFELRPTLPAEGVSLAEVGGGHSEKVVEHMKRMAADGGVELTFPDHVPNTHYALALAEYARDLGPEAHEAIHEAIFEAYNARAEDIGAEDVVLAIAEKHALDVEAVRSALHEGRYDERLHQFYHLALAFGVNATPSALICNELMIGSRPYAVLEQSVERCLVAEHNIAQHVAFVPGENPAEESHAQLAEQPEGAPPSIER